MSETRKPTAAERYDRALQRSHALWPLPEGCPVPRPTTEWPAENVALLERYREWLEAGGAARSVIDQHRIPMAGHVLGLALKPHDQLDISTNSIETADGNLGRAMAYIEARDKSDSWTRNGRYSLTWFWRFLRLERGLVVEKKSLDSYDCKVTPHMLRHTFATQLVNAGCKATTIQALLGHKRLNSTMVYARVHDETVATDYFTAMTLFEERLETHLNRPVDQQPQANGYNPEVNGSTVQLLELVTALQSEPLTESQQEMVAELQQGLAALTDYSLNGTSKQMDYIVNER